MTGDSVVAREVRDDSTPDSGDELVRLRSDEQLTLHPANYRLVYHHLDHSSDGGHDD